MTSFFEKLTGAEEESSSEDKQPTNTSKAKKNKEPKTAKKKTRSGSKANKKTMKKQTKSIKLKPTQEEPKNEEWLEESEEEGRLTIDVYQEKDDIIVKSTIAGVDPDNIDISITSDMVTIKGKREKEESVSAEDYYYQELYWGSFSRSIVLPTEVDADKAKAEIKKGILTIKLPKLTKTKTKKIKVKGSE
ncbi:MAG: Hsp20 family protein [Candidatus Portnoybacteria bacterium]|nr:Hsp20 family protein [Candidatus Portnoybacteria bacterium]